jgi:hypothetical protein
MHPKQLGSLNTASPTTVVGARFASAFFLCRLDAGRAIVFPGEHHRARRSSFGSLQRKRDLRGLEELRFSPGQIRTSWRLGPMGRYSWIVLE